MQDELKITRERIESDRAVRFTSGTHKGVMDVDELDIAENGWPETMKTVYEYFMSQPVKAVIS